jgi:O-methyltransferase involved in polyketide biosynthesis
MVLAAMEQREPAERRLVDDDVAARFLPAPTRWLLTATPPALLQRLMMSAIERSGPGMWANFVFTYVRRDFIDGVNFYGAQQLYRRFRQRQQLWRFGLQPEEVASFLDGHGWRLVQQLGPEQIVQHYVEPTGRNLTASQVEWSAYAHKA